MSERFTTFKERASADVDSRRWFRSIGVVPLLVAGALFVGVGALMIWRAQDGWRAVYPRWSDVVLIALGVCAIVNAVMLGLSALPGGLWRRRTPAAQQEAERWQAFRRYLSDFPRLQEAPPASLALWERYLVYGIAFGIADRVLQGAQIHMPQAVHDASSLYWISSRPAISAPASRTWRSPTWPRASATRSRRQTPAAGGWRRLLRWRRGRRWRRGGGAW